MIRHCCANRTDHILPPIPHKVHFFFILKVTLSVGSKLKIKCGMYSRTMKKHFPPLKKEYRIEVCSASQ